MGKNLTILTKDINSKAEVEKTGSEDIIGRQCIYKATWVSPDQATEKQIDHIHIKKFIRFMEGMRAKKGRNIDSSHHLEVTKLKLDLKKYWTT